MMYTKPEVAVLGDAENVIQTLGKGKGSAQDPQLPTVFNYSAAYDLDD